MPLILSHAIINRFLRRKKTFDWYKHCKLEENGERGQETGGGRYCESSSSAILVRWRSVSSSWLKASTKSVPCLVIKRMKWSLLDTLASLVRGGGEFEWWGSQVLIVDLMSSSMASLDHWLVALVEGIFLVAVWRPQWMIVRPGLWLNRVEFVSTFPVIRVIKWRLLQPFALLVWSGLKRRGHFFVTWTRVSSRLGGRNGVLRVSGERSLSSPFVCWMRTDFSDLFGSLAHWRTRWTSGGQVHSNFTIWGRRQWTKWRNLREGRLENVHRRWRTWTTTGWLFRIRFG